MRRSALAALLLANVAVFTYVVGYLDQRGPVWRYAPLVAAALLLLLALNRSSDRSTSSVSPSSQKCSINRARSFA